MRDRLGSTTGLTDDDGAMTATYQYDAFGAVKTKTGAADTEWRFTGELQDSQAARGLYYLRARYYDPALGRFLSRDPLLVSPGDSQMLDRYAYVRSNSLNHADPTCWRRETTPSFAGWFANAQRL